jgi:hypothetical protein
MKIMELPIRELVYEYETQIHIGLPEGDTRIKVMRALNKHHMGQEQVPTGRASIKIPHALMEAVQAACKIRQRIVKVKIYSDGSIEHLLR